MLEVKNLVKHYSTKGGVTVKALDNVSVTFPETGMVFLLGRSGSGKSTLLNVSGGLDKPDSGEIIVKGRSSKDFSQADFDSYRNTYVGFVFQEYNILNDFTVEQNIALALQLQSKPNDKKAVNDILNQVDLKGLGKRKPNTLSGGQKQRVAIARALIKNPEIIFADEPTGALDSNTGRQVLDTLKKLSETKLVVVVSHDREFAEFYGDRIIELKDGQILSDVTKEVSHPKQLNENVQIVSDDTITIKNAEEVTEADVKNILNVLKKNKGEAIITAGKRELPEVKRACKINDNGNREYFADTKHVEIKEYDGKKTKFIKSRLPISHAVKMGASGLKTKPVRLIFTILLSIIAFTLFGVVSTFMLYDPNYSVSEALKQANYPSLTVGKNFIATNQQYQIDNVTGKETLDYEYDETYKTRFGVQELKDKNASQIGNGAYAGIFDFTNNRWDSGQNIDLMFFGGANPISPNVGETLKYYYPVKNVFGFTDCGENYMRRNGFTPIGQSRYPKNKTEIAIPEYFAKLFLETSGSGIEQVTDVIGKHMKFVNCSAIPSSEKFTIVGVYKIDEIPEKYNPLKDSTSTELSVTEKDKLKASLVDFLRGSFNTIIYVTPDFYDAYKGGIVANNNLNINSYYTRGLMLSQYKIDAEFEEWWGSNVYTERTVKDYSKYVKVYDMQGNLLSNDTFTIDENQIYVSKRVTNEQLSMKVSGYLGELLSLKDYDTEAREILNSKFEGGVGQLWGLNDFSEYIEIINKWYPMLRERQYLLNTYYRLVGFDEIPDRVRQAGDKLSEHVYNFSMQTGTINEEQEWSILKNWIDQNLKTKFPQIYYYEYATELNYYDIEIIESLDALLPEGKTWWNVVENKMRIGKATEQDFAIIKKALTDGTYREIVGHDMIEGDARFIPNLEFDIQKYYYINYLQQTGSLDVVGYFDIDEKVYGSEYLVADSFRLKYSQFLEGEEEFTWKYIEVTDYEEPEDAKYNYIIRRTNNTQEEISEALTGGVATTLYITNNVYQELQFFLELITNLEQIFLIVGIVMGVFSGLMLLNFISVSISAKRKDIGILRAVGARGSDVFKIFFAEAFIIALICFIISSIGAYVVCGVLNGTMSQVVMMKLLHFQPINVLMILLVSFGISVIATYFPVRFAAKKSPVESIRAL